MSCGAGRWTDSWRRVQCQVGEGRQGQSISCALRTGWQRAHSFFPLSPSGAQNQVVSGGYDKILKLWDVDRQQVVKTLYVLCTHDRSFTSIRSKLIVHSSRPLQHRPHRPCYLDRLWSSLLLSDPRLRIHRPKHQDLGRLVRRPRPLDRLFARRDLLRRHRPQRPTSPRLFQGQLKQPL